LAETPEVPHTKLVGNSHSFLMVYQMAQNVLIGPLWVTAIGNSTGCSIRISRQIGPSCMNQVFGEILPWPPQILCIWKMSLTNSAFFRLLIRHVSTYGLIAKNFLSQVSTQIRFWTGWLCSCLVRSLGHKMGETCWDLNTWSEDHLLSFPTPTQTQVSDAHSHGYGHFSTATCGVRDLLKIGLSTGWSFWHDYRQQ
jgi:hypothetical protein